MLNTSENLNAESKVTLLLHDKISLIREADTPIVRANWEIFRFFSCNKCFSSTPGCSGIIFIITPFCISGLFHKIVFFIKKTNFINWFVFFEDKMPLYTWSFCKKTKKQKNKQKFVFSVFCSFRKYLHQKHSLHTQFGLVYPPCSCFFYYYE